MRLLTGISPPLHEAFATATSGKRRRFKVEARMLGWFEVTLKAVSNRTTNKQRNPWPLLGTEPKPEPKPPINTQRTFPRTKLMDVAMEPESLAKLARPALPGAPELRAELHEVHILTVGLGRLCFF